MQTETVQRPTLSPFLISLILLVLALIPRWLIVAQPIPVQLDKALPDDAYYYMLTAQNIVQGNGPAVDGIHANNGWHPLWMVVNVAVFSLPYSEPDTPVRVLLALGALCDSLVAVVLYRVARRYIGEAAIVAGVVYALNGMPLFQSVNGLETGLAALMIALAGAATLALVENARPRNALVWGILCGLCFLSRTDTALIIVWLGLYVLIASAHRVQNVVIGGVAALVVVAPWLVWNQANFGSALVQVSSIAVPWAAQTRWLADNPDSSLVALALNVISQPTYWLRGDYLGAPVFFGFLLWPLALYGFWRGWRGKTDVETGLKIDTRRLATLAILLALGGISLVLVHTLVRWYPRPWYFVVMAQSLSLGLSLAWFYTSSRRLRFIAAEVGLIALVISAWYTWQVGFYPWQRQLQYAGALWVRDNTPPDARIAAMNSGIIGYYGGRPTTNLDGVVNPAAFEAIKQTRLLDFMRESDIDYFMDVDYALEFEYGRFMGGDYPAGLREIEPVGEPYPYLGYIRAYTVEPNSD